jgi:hypothetical protein
MSKDSTRSSLTFWESHRFKSVGNRFSSRRSKTEGSHPEMQATLLILQLTILLAVANGTPVLATKLCGYRFSPPLDNGIRFIDGKPLFGKSKTIRGVVLSILLT